MRYGGTHCAGPSCPRGTGDDARSAWLDGLRSRWEGLCAWFRT
jgi:hypothetical protein